MIENPLVGIVMGSDSDWPLMKSCAEMLKRFGIAYEAKVLSAHRTPDAALAYAAKTRYRQADAPCRIDRLEDDLLELGFEQPQWAVTPGQSAVLYQGEVCLGGGVIQ